MFQTEKFEGRFDNTALPQSCCYILLLRIPKNIIRLCILHKLHIPSIFWHQWRYVFVHLGTLYLSPVVIYCYCKSLRTLDFAFYMRYILPSYFVIRARLSGVIFLCIWELVLTASITVHKSPENPYYLKDSFRFVRYSLSLCQCVNNVFFIIIIHTWSIMQWRGKHNLTWYSNY